MPRRAGGYDCVYKPCDFHADDLVTLARHGSAVHHTVNLTAEPTWLAVDWAGNVLDGADDLAGRRKLELDYPGAEILHRITWKARRHDGHLPRVGK